MQKRNFWRATSVAGLAVVMSSSCAMIKNLDDMHDGMVSMDDTTKRMKNSTADMNEKMDATNEEIHKTNLYIAAQYSDLRQGSAATLRIESLRRMEESDSIEAKISNAALFYMALEFQLWKNFGKDTEESRIGLYDQAMAQYFRELPEYTHNKSTLDPSSTNDDMESVDALAVAMHFANPNALMLDEKRNIKAMTVLKLIEDTLKERWDIWAMPFHVQRDKVPEYKREILKNQELAVYMLQVRHNFLAAMALAKISDLKAGGWKGFWAKLDAYFTKWEGKLVRNNITQLDFANVWVTEAIRTRDKLVELGYEPKYNSKLKRIFGHMTFSTGQFPRPSTGKTPRDKAIMSNQIEAMGQLLNSIAIYRDPKSTGWKF